MEKEWGFENVIKARCMEAVQQERHIKTHNIETYVFYF